MTDADHELLILKKLASQTQLELDPTQLSDALECLSKLTTLFVNGINEAPAYKPIRTSRSPSNHLGETGSDPVVALQEAFERILAEGSNNASGRFFAYIPGGGIPVAAFGDFIGALTNRFSGYFSECPGAVEMENEVIRWLLQEFKFPDGAWGTFTSGGSMANFFSILTARETRTQMDWAKSVLYLSDQAHHSLKKSLKMAGLAHVPTRILQTQVDRKIIASEFENMVRSDLAQGLIPWMCFGTAGTTNTGTVDPLNALSEICQKFKIWFHVDGAYGGFFQLAQSGQSVLQGIEKADSVTLDPHKSLFMPYGSGILLVKDRQLLKKAFSESADYLLDIVDHEQEPSPANYSGELSRPNRSLRLWLSLRVFGIAQFRAALEEKLLLTRWLWKKLSFISAIELGPEPELSTLIFRAKPTSGATQVSANQRTQILLTQLLSNGKIRLSPTQLGDKLFLRVCILSFRSHIAEVQACFEEISRIIGAEA